MEKAFLAFIKNIQDPSQLEIDELRELNNKINSFIEYTNSENRLELQHLDEIKGHLKRIGALIEISKIYDVDANYYIERDPSRYILSKYRAISFRIQGYAKESTKKEIEKFIELSCLNNRDFPFCPVFLNVLGAYHLLYEDNYISAIKCYKKALEYLEKIDSAFFTSITTYKYESMKYIFMNNLLDAMVRSSSPQKYLKEINSLKKELYGSEKEISTESMLDIAELYAMLGKIKDSMTVLSSIEGNNIENIVFFYPQIYLVRSIISLKRNDIPRVFDYVIKSFEYSFKGGKPLSQRENISCLFRIIGELLAGKEFKERISIFEEKGFLSLILKVIGIKDRYLAMAHSQSVADLSVKLWERISNRKKALDHIYLSGLFHDVGKLSIPRFTLIKPTPLDSIDREIIRYHTLEGFRLLSMLGFDGEAKVAGDHHERIDGSGYLRGKKRIGKDTEVVAIADVFQAALTPNRNYRRPKQKETILKEIEDNVRQHKFHSEIFNALVSVA